MLIGNCKTRGANNPIDLGSINDTTWPLKSIVTQQFVAISKALEDIWLIPRCQTMCLIYILTIIKVNGGEIVCIYEKPCLLFSIHEHTLTEIIVDMMTSSYGNIFRITGHLCGEFTDLRWIPRTKASDAELWCFFDLRLNKRLGK